MDEGKTHLAGVFEREKARFLGFVRRQLDGFSDMDAEDILADVTYRMFSRADLVEEVENLTAYIYRALANRIADHRRKDRPVVSLDHGGEGDWTSPPALQPEHDGPDPEQVYHQAQLREQLRVAIGRLGPRERQVWVAIEIDGRSFRELAQAWDEPIGTLLSRKSRATAKLRELLSDYRIKPQE
ncbi:MAG: sigma-70 family RNA polymerase sigma factor [Holophaga sp.]|nr:sigma-70 family RNA polymerase sigma factor [Holophaga sp.]